MKRTFILVVFSAAIALLSLTGSSSGPAFSGSGDNTGRVSPALTCAAGGCHGAATADIQLTAAFIDKTTGEPLAGGYVPGNIYEIQLDAVNGVNANTRFGFQAVLVTGSNTQAGSINTSGLDADYRLATAGGIGLVEHRRTITAGTPGNEYHVAFDWTAPQVGTGQVTLWAIFNAVNGNGRDDAGDRCNTPFSTTIQEHAGSSVAGITQQEIPVRIYPNPVADYLNVQVQYPTPGNYTAIVYDLSGKRVYKAGLSSLVHTNGLHIPVHDWAPGMYVFRIMQDGGSGQSVIPFIRQ